jgi:hypothetical protein
MNSCRTCRRPLIIIDLDTCSLETKNSDSVKIQGFDRRKMAGAMNGVLAQPLLHLRRYKLPNTTRPLFFHSFSASTVVLMATSCLV